jgi:parallel beta-helix repeat protein
MNVAQDGDTVYVFNGSYLNEVLYINKSINFIGENRDTTLIVRDDAWTITIFANHVNISEFSMWVGKGGVMSNVKLRIRSDNCTVTDMKFIAPLTALCKGDIVLYGANFNTIKNNIYSDNVSGGFFPRIGPAIRLEHSCNNIIEDNTIHMFLSALVLQNSSNGNMIMNNTIHTGCLIDGSSNNMITRNNLSKIAITNSFNINITDNNFQEYTFKDWKLMGPQVDFTTSDIFLDHNYWGRSRLLPKVFFGHDGTKHVMEVDWHPAKEPNQIS